MNHTTPSRFRSPLRFVRRNLKCVRTATANQTHTLWAFPLSIVSIDRRTAIIVRLFYCHSINTGWSEEKVDHRNNEAKTKTRNLILPFIFVCWSSYLVVTTRMKITKSVFDNIVTRAPHRSGTHTHSLRIDTWIVSLYRQWVFVYENCSVEIGGNDEMTDYSLLTGSHYFIIIIY